jgi:dienelactone hydrolase
VSPTTRPTTQPALPYPVAHDAPLWPTRRVLYEEKDHRRYGVEFDGIKGDRVPAYLYVPKDGKATHPAVLLQYGSGGNKDTFYIVALGKQFVARGFVVLTIDVPNRGARRFRDPNDNRGFLLRLLSGTGTLRQTMGDYSRAIDYLMSLPDVDHDRVGYAGISLGAITGIPFVAHDERIHAMASIVGGGNFLGALKVPIAPDVQAVAEQIDPFYHVALIAPRPLLLINVTRDQLVPRILADALQKAAPAYAKRVWLECDHFFNGIDRATAAGDVLDWVKENLPKRE